MDRDTILIVAECELRRLPLDAVEAFVLSQIDGRLTLEEIGEVVGLDLVKTMRLAERLVEVGAATSATSATSATRLDGRATPRGESRRRASVPAEEVSVRIDPRAEVLSVRPPPNAAGHVVSVRVDPRVEVSSMRPPRAKSSSMRHEARKEGRRSLRSMRAASIPAPARERSPARARTRAEDEEICELDAATHAEIAELHARMRTLDHYAVLGVERGAEKRDVKRAYFEMASKYHPDRFSGKKLGEMRAPLQHLFIRLTEAHDTLSVRARREAYDATLPPERRAAPRLSRKMKASIKPPLSAKASIKPPPASAKASIKPPPAITTSDGDKFGRLQATARLLAAQKRADVFLRAAEEALKADDVINAANNFRLALQFADDPFVRRKLEAVDAAATARRYDKSIVRARAAERNERWDEAAHYFAKANEARAEAEAAERAAYALRRSNGDLEAAAKLGEQAVALAPNNASYHVTLAEIYLAAGEDARAKAASELALELAPKDGRAQGLAAALRRRA